MDVSTRDEHTGARTAEREKKLSVTHRGNNHVAAGAR